MDSNDGNAATGSPGRPEYLGSGGPVPERDEGASPRRGRRAGLLVAAGVAVLGAVGVGAYGFAQLMSGGESAASAVPASAVAFVSLDLDPSAGQKIEAVKILRKFPALRSQLDLSSRDDLRRFVFDRIQQDGDCTDLDYADDVEPWVGDRVALAAVPRGTSVAPLLAVQVTDADAAVKGVRALATCSGSTVPVGVATSGEYLLLSETQSDADAMAAAAGNSSLEDDAAFATWMDRTGDPGIVTMYASKQAPAAILAAEESARSEGGAGLPGQRSRVEAALRGFRGAGAVIRFRDGAVEAEFAAQGVGRSGGASAADGGPDVATLPATTAAALSFALPDGWLDDAMDRWGDLGPGPDDALGQAEAQTGLNLPEDLATLLGKGVSLSVDSSLDPRAVADSPDPATIPAGLRITGDAEAITAVIEKIKTAVGPQADAVRVQSAGDQVGIGADPDYVASLLEDGALGEQDSFGRVVPNADRAASVLYLNFDAGDGWAERMADLVSDSDPEVVDNVRPLDALGASVWQDDDQVQHGLVRLTTD